MDKENPRTIVFIGDSITDCDRLFDSDLLGLGQGYVRMIAGHLGKKAKVINRGHNGFTAFQVEACLREDCLRFCPDEISLLVGINDVSAYLGGAGGYGAEVYQDYLCRILCRCREAGVERFTLMEPFLFPWPAEYLTWMNALSDFQRAARTAAEKEGVRFLPLAEIFRETGKRYSPEQLTTDGIHLTTLGHSILARAWLSLDKTKKGSSL